MRALQMRTTGPFSQFNRTIALRKPDGKAPELDKSLLGIFGAGEAKFLQAFVQWADADRTTYA